jgi:hypothetical protein
MKLGGLHSTVPVACGHTFTQAPNLKISEIEADEGLLAADWTAFKLT